MDDRTKKTKGAEAAPATSGRTIRWWARFYDLAAWATSFGQEPAIRRATLAAAGLAPGERVLDVGCGTGTLALAAWQRVRPDGEVVGIDASPEMIGIARQKSKSRASEAHFEVAAIESLPFDDGHFDAVLSSFMLHHLPDDVKQSGCAEIRRVLKPSGRFVAVDLADSGRSLFGRLAGLLGHAMPAGYVDGLITGVRTAGFEGVEEVATSFRYLAFLRATKPVADAQGESRPAVPGAEASDASG